jgi:hypothetical protein
MSNIYIHKWAGKSLPLWRKDKMQGDGVPKKLMKLKKGLFRKKRRKTALSFSL